MDYAIKKEKFLIEADPEMPEKTKINHMVIGLPINIQNELDKHEIKETNYLLSLVQKYDSENSVINKINIIEKSDYLNRSKADYNFAKQIKKKPNLITKSKLYFMAIEGVYDFSIEYLLYFLFRF